jgi:hypothetical protein
MKSLENEIFLEEEPKQLVAQPEVVYSDSKEN